MVLLKLWFEAEPIDLKDAGKLTAKGLRLKGCRRKFWNGACRVAVAPVDVLYAILREKHVNEWCLSRA
jgi:hypothetical protein